VQFSEPLLVIPWGFRRPDFMQPSKPLAANNARWITGKFIDANGGLRF
jgi:hypothetical protein